MGLYAADGSWNVRNVVGDVYTGLYASDGAINIITGAGSGAYHPCGALRISLTVDIAGPRQNASGGLNVTDQGFNNGSQKVTILS